MRKSGKKLLILILLLSLVLGCASSVFALTEDSSALQTETSKYMKYFTQEVDGGGYWSWEDWEYISNPDYCRLDINGIASDGSAIQTTYSEYGYFTYIKVGSNSKEEVELPKLGGIYTTNGVQTSMKASFVNNGKTVKVVYTVENTNSEAVTLQLGSCADTQIGETSAGDCCYNYMSTDYQQLKMEYDDRYYTITADASTPFTGAWVGYYGSTSSSSSSSYHNKVFTTGTEFVYGSENGRQGSEGDSAMAWHWDISLAAGQSIEKVCYFQLANLLEVTNVQCIADAEAGQVHLIVDYTDGMNRTQTLYYTPQSGSQGTDTSNTNSSNVGQFSTYFDVPSSWKAGNTYYINLYVTDSAGTVSDTYTFKVTWPEKQSDGDMYITLSFRNTSEPFASVRDVPGATIVLPTDAINGYLFLGWNTAEDGTGTWYDGGSTYTIKHIERILYAQWGTAQNYSVTVLKDGAAYTGRTVTLKSSTGKSYTLTENNGVYSVSAIPGTDYSVYIDGVDTGLDVTNAAPTMTVNYWTVSFNLNGHGTGSIASQVVLNGANATKPTDPSDGDYLFKGWFTTSTGETAFDFSAGVTATTQLYAKWGTLGIDDATISDIPDQVYNHSAICPTLTVTYKGKTLQLGTDYTVTYSNNTNAGTATAVITGLGAYGGSVTKTFKITQRVLGLTWGKNTFTYDGQSHVPTLTVSNVVSGDTCTVAVSGAQINAGTYTASAGTPSNSNYVLPSSGVTRSFTISKAKYDMSSVKFTGATVEYDGASHSIVIADKLPNGVTVTYENNTGTAVGTYNAVAKFATSNANYETPTSLTATLKITARSMSKVTVGDVADYTYSKTEYKPALNVTYNGTKLIEGTDYTVTYKNNINVGTATATITGKGGYSGTTTKTYKIVARELTLTWGTDTFAYDGKSHAPALTVGNVVSGDTCTVSVSGAQTNAGTYTAKAGTPSNSNYKLPSTGTTKSFTITKD